MKYLPPAVGLLLSCVAGPLWAWSNHSLGTALAVRDSQLLLDVAPVRVESLDSFLQAETAGLQALLDQQEDFARANFPNYPARPDDLRWLATGAGERQRGFLMALRLNPEIKLASFVQPVPGSDDWQGRKTLPMAEVMVYSDLSAWESRYRFYRVSPGDQISALSVVATAADEPDYGHDINLFSDNPGDVGARYNFGEQPFGDARFEYSAQAPFHMGFYHESEIVVAAAPYLTKTYPELRAYQFFSLARFAFDTGHPYWGCRFLGWGLHYIQDLTQPYHAKVMPGSTTPDLLWIAGKNLAGLPEDQAAAIKRVADRHTAIETFQLSWLSQLLANGNTDNPMFAAYSDSGTDGSYPAFDAHYLRNVVSAQSYANADALDEQIGLWLTASHGSKGFSQGNDLAKSEPVDPQMQAVLVELIRHFGAHTRNALKATQESVGGDGKVPSATLVE